MGLLGNGLMLHAGLRQGQLQEFNLGEGDSGTFCTKQFLKGVLIPHRRGGDADGDRDRMDVGPSRLQLPKEQSECVIAQPGAGPGQGAQWE